MSKIQAFIGPTDLGLRRPGLVERVVGLAYHAGLVPREVRVRSEDPSLQTDALASGLVGVLQSSGIAGEVHGSMPGARLPASPEVITRIAADPKSAAVEIMGQGWALSLPLEPGLAVGVAEDLDIASEGALRMLLGLFDACLSDWAIAGFYDSVAAALRDYPVTLGPGPLPPPPIGRFTWRSPDLLTDIEVLDCRLSSSIEVHRSITGAVALMTGADTDLNAVYAALPRFTQTWDRPPIRWFSAPNRDSFPLRLISPYLKHRQEVLAQRAAERSGVTTGGLQAVRVVETRLGTPKKSTQEKEEISAFIGEAALSLGGRWYRLLDPTVSFPVNLVMLIHDRLPFYPQAAVERWCNGDMPPSVVLEKVVDMLD